LVLSDLQIFVKFLPPSQGVGAATVYRYVGEKYKRYRTSKNSSLIVIDDNKDIEDDAKK
jgi:hypothetical protein